MRAPLVVVVTGMPAAGKTTIAEVLSRDLRLPLVSRDKIKERLYDTLGVGDLEWSGRLGGAAFALLFDSARLMIESGHSVMLEANFFRGTEQEFSALPSHRAIQIHCEAPLDVLIARYAGRPRHERHHARSGETEGTARTLSERRSRTAGPPRPSDRRRYITSR